MVTGHFYTGMLDHRPPLVGFITGQVERIREIIRRRPLDQVGCEPFVAQVVLGSELVPPGLVWLFSLLNLRLDEVKFRRAVQDARMVEVGTADRQS